MLFRQMNARLSVWSCSEKVRWLLSLVFLCCGWLSARADDWPQWLGPERDGVWREAGILKTFPSEGLKPRWRVAIGSGYAGPAVAVGRVYVMDRLLAEGTKKPSNVFSRGRIEGRERIVCLDESTGRELWKHDYDCPYAISYPAGPRATPLVDGPRIYTLGAMGDLLCLESETGKVVWQKNLPSKYRAAVPLWGFAAHPLVDGNKLICLVGGPGSVVVAFDKASGKELWRALSATEPGYCPPMIYQVGGKRQLIVWHPEAVNGLDPETGKVYWSQRFPVKAGLSIPTPRKAGDLLFVTSFYNGSLMLRFEPDKTQPVVVWKGKRQSEHPDQTDGLHSIMPTPFLVNGYIYGVCSYGELRCLKADTGERVWESLQATGAAPEHRDDDRWRNAFLVQNEERFFLFNEEGDLIIAQLMPEGYHELSRTHILEPTNNMPGRLVVWSHPAFANKCIFARNDKEIICVSLAADKE
jgi:outer membrane protein assembly factor BamB